jgi:hypothetical protein
VLDLSKLTKAQEGENIVSLLTLRYSNLESFCENNQKKAASIIEKNTWYKAEEKL